ncbi:YggS family pyridoxal phosphate-dependent enzyme [Desulfurispira natronophila]|uniref:Pyridoxal phosphate homeostasis protein n=1 Tax=Desulfurispira natronophila TaxID=682562 RepID=A0A7W7Y4A1_9BACT|nr:YggS family pyridoxal phosphate-dependent enzyme [Desulfurispira natronophila]MBB5021836.1 hypothetical protein [Desulfurispira natronophila]
MDGAKGRYLKLYEEIATKAQQLGQPEPTLVAVSKTFGPEAIAELYEAGCRDFGENRLHEFSPKAASLPNDIRWHFVGQLQSRKAKDVIGIAHMVHSLDRTSLATAMSHQAQKQGVVQQCLLQVNIGQEPQKGGLLPEDLASFARQLLSLEGIVPMGLMCLPPADEDPRPHFRRLRQLCSQLHEDGLLAARELSMGMSSDYAIAMEEGSTMLRVGSHIFGDRS